MPRSSADLRDRLRAADGRGYKAYGALAGEYSFASFLLAVDHVQADPFAAPSRLRVRVPQDRAQFPADLFASAVRRVALADYLARQLAAALRRLAKGHRGSGRSGLLAVDAGGQEILERAACVVNADYVEVRLVAGLPAAGRTCLGREAAMMLLEELPQAVQAALFFAALDPAPMRQHVAVAEDQQALRAQLAERGLVAFVANGALLPRESGASDRPLAGPGVVPFFAPAALQVELVAPKRGPIAGLGIPAGVTLIVGGGFHGKSTLLSALARSVYDHIPGDGREYVVTRADAVKIRAEEGRRVEKVDISPFIANLPFQQDTTAFSTANASGSTSQAANIVEALEAGSGLLLVDEDTSATNFMLRDARMQRLVPKAKEPITPFIDQVRNLHTQLGVATILVAGGSGDYFEVADTVILMDHYRPAVVTAQAHALVETLPSQRTPEATAAFGRLVARVPVPDSVDAQWHGRPRVDARGLAAIVFGAETIDLSAVEQLVDPSQTRAIGAALAYARQRGYFDGRQPLVVALQRVLRDVDEHGLDAISPFRGQHPGELARPRLQELAAALNRLRTLQVR